MTDFLFTNFLQVNANGTTANSLAGVYDKYLYIGFAIILIISLTLDILYLTRNVKPMSVRSAFNQSLIWVSIAVGFGLVLGYIEGWGVAAEYYSAYLMEYSLSMDNIFVFVLILTFFKVSTKYYSKVLFWGILMAIVFRLIFIAIGFELVERFHWLLYIFGAFLIYTGYKILFAGNASHFDPNSNFVYRYMKKHLAIIDEEGGGKLSVRIDGKKYYTRIFLVVVIIATTDIIFALDSIPAAFGVTRHMLVIITSNVLAIIGLRAMFFMLMHAVNKFRYLQQGISFVLMFIGGKMLAEIFHYRVGIGFSLSIIAVMLIGSITMSVLIPAKQQKDAEG